MKTEQRSVEARGAQLVDRAARYPWTVKNAPGEFVMIGGRGLHHEIRREMAMIGQSGSRVSACAIAKYLNKQRLPARLKIELN